MVGSGHMAGIAVEFDRLALVCGARVANSESGPAGGGHLIAELRHEFCPRQARVSSGGSVVARAMSAALTTRSVRGSSW